MAMPPDHAALLSRHDFVPHPAGDFDDSERTLLVRYGRWLEALAKGAIAPITPEQDHFLQASRGECQPTSPFERAWIKHCRAGGTNGATQGRIGPLEASERLARLTEARTAATALHAEYDAEKEAILDQVRAQLEALDRAYHDLLRAADEEVAKREDEVRKAVLQLGTSAQHKDLQAIFCRGRVTWDSRALEQYAETHPELIEYRRVGAPSVRIRYHTP